jgi:hypothetical protein
MRCVLISVLTVASVLTGGCTVPINSPTPESNPPIWGRVDCQRGEGNPEIQKQFDDAKATCLARGKRADMVAGTTGGSPCMAEQGYILRTRAEHEVACQRVEQQNAKPAAQKKKKAKPSPVSAPTEPASPAKQ